MDGRSRRAEEAREQRKQQILDAALRVFAERGYHGSSVSQIVKAAGVARGTFYLYFDAKEAIFRELLEGLLGTLRGSVIGVDLEGPGLEEQLVRILSQILETSESNRALTRVIFREAVGLDAEIDAILAEFYQELVGYIELALRIGEAVGMVRAVSDRQLVATCVIGSVRAVVQQHVVDSSDPFDIERVARVVVEHNLRGLV